MPFSDDGPAELAGHLEHVDEVVEPPALVWLFCADVLMERRGVLYGWRTGPPRRALVGWRHNRVDVVSWLCEPCLRPRNE